MLASAGLLLIFVILCVVSFVTARKEMAAQKKAEADFVPCGVQAGNLEPSKEPVVRESK